MRGFSVTVMVCGLVAAGAVEARADEPPGGWVLSLECRAPRGMPVRSDQPLRLSCRIRGDRSLSGAVLALVEPLGPIAFWQTLNPFAAARAAELGDPFAVPVRYVDPFERGSYDRTRAARELRDPFEAAPPASGTDDEASDEP